MAHLPRVGASVCATSLLVAVSIACSDSGSDGGEGPAGIGPNGGTVIDRDGQASVEIPSGALVSQTPIAVSKVAPGSVAALPVGLTLISDVFSFTPHGTSFAVPATVRLPYSGGGDELWVVGLDDESDQSWEMVAGASFAGGVAAVQVDGFSLLAVASVDDDLPETTVELSWLGPGRVVPDVAGVECAQSPCTFALPMGSTVKLDASPQGDGAGLVRWAGVDCDRAECTFGLTGERVTVEARFGWVLSVGVLGAPPAGPVQGDLLSVPSGIEVDFADLGDPATAFFEPGTEVVLTANPGPGTNLAAWGGACAASRDARSCTVTMDGQKTVTFAVCDCESVTVVLDGSGRIAATPDDLFGTSCQREGCTDPDRCRLWYGRGETVTLQATPSARGLGWRFDSGWSGAGCSGVDSCTVTVDGPTEVTASFDYPVSFQQDIFDGILQEAGLNCVFCHNPNPPDGGIEAEATGLLFSLAPSAVRRLIVEEPARGDCAAALGEPKRINETNVADSLMVRYPLPEGMNGCETHGLVDAFQSTSDALYRDMFDWIAGGCPFN